MTEQLQEQPGTPTEEQPTTPGDVSAQEKQPETSEDAPFFVARTQEDFNKKAGLSRESIRNAVIKDLGFDDPDELKETVEAYRAMEAELETEAEKVQRQLEKVQPKAEKAERYEQALQKHLEAQREGIPEHIGALLDRMDPVDQLEWISENREAIAESGKPASVGRGSAPGSSASPRLDFTTMSQAEFEQLQARVRAGEIISP